MRQPAAAGASPARGARRAGCPGRTGLRRRSRLASPPSGGAPAVRHCRRQPRRSCTRPPLPLRRGTFWRPQRLSHGHRGRGEKPANLKNRRGKKKKIKKPRGGAGAGARRCLPRAAGGAAVPVRGCGGGGGPARGSPGDGGGGASRPRFVLPIQPRASRAAPARPHWRGPTAPRRHWLTPPPPRQCARPGRGALTPSTLPAERPDPSPGTAARGRLRALPRSSREGQDASGSAWQRRQRQAPVAELVNKGKSSRRKPSRNISTCY